MNDTDRARDSIGSTAFGRAAQLEWCIRKRDIKPLPDRPDQVRWAEEGPRDWRDLDTVKYGHESIPFRD